MGEEVESINIMFLYCFKLLGSSLLNHRMKGRKSDYPVAFAMGWSVCSAVDADTAKKKE